MDREKNHSGGPIETASPDTPKPAFVESPSAKRSKMGAEPASNKDIANGVDGANQFSASAASSEEVPMEAYNRCPLTCESFLDVPTVKCRASAAYAA